MTKEDKKDAQSVIDLAKLRNDKEYEWMKNVIISASTLLGILITLHSKKSEDIYIHIIAIVNNNIFFISNKNSKSSKSFRT